MDIRENVPLSDLTTFKIGGTARYFADIRSETDLREAILWGKGRGIRIILLSGGSNVLVPDEGLDGLVLHFVGNLYSVDNGKVDSWTGTNLLTLIQSMGAQGFGGWEKLSGIPGSVGGAVRGNAGAFGPEIKDFVVSVRALNWKTDETKEFTNDVCDFSYRHSFFKDNPDWIILRAEFQLQKIEPKESARASGETILEREKRHLQNVQAAGSFFMNPTVPADLVALFEMERGVKSRENRVPAGWLIEKAGQKGAIVGGAIASLQHPNYIVNQGSATSHDVRNLAQMIKLEVYNLFGVELHEEAALL